MQVGDDRDLQSCRNPGTVAGRLLSTRNIYLRQELRTISKQIQGEYKERLPALHLVAVAAYEQVFNRQPLSLPEQLRQDAVKYALRYYQLHLDKLRLAEAQNGLSAKLDVQHSSSLKEMGSEQYASDSSRTNDTILHPTSSCRSSTSTDQSSTRPSKVPKIVVRRASDSSFSSTDTSNSSTIIDDNLLSRDHRDGRGHYHM